MGKRKLDKGMQDSVRFSIDFIELAFLAEACIPPVPIARHSFWMDLIYKHWHSMSEDERKRLFDWMNRTDRFDRSDEDCNLFYLRFNPDNQYIVTTEYKGEIKEHRCFKDDAIYQCGERAQHINEDFIIDVKKLEL